MDGWMDGWIDRFLCTCIIFFFILRIRFPGCYSHKGFLESSAVLIDDIMKSSNTLMRYQFSSMSIDYHLNAYVLENRATFECVF
jgi:hypothetical protein